MVRLDRFWWVGLLALPLIIASGVAVAVLSVTRGTMVIPVIGLAIPFTFRPGAAWIALLSLGYAFQTIRRMIRRIRSVRRRQRLRVRALDGDLAALAPADIYVDPSNAPDVTNEPFELWWHTGGMHPLFEFLPLLLIVISVIGMVVSVVALDSLLTSTILSGADEADVLTGVVTAVLGGAAVILILMRRMGFMLPSSLVGVSASEDGLCQLSAYGESTLIRWEDARLFEVGRVLGSSSTREYMLFAHDGFVTWYNSTTAPSELLPDDMTIEDWTLDQQALLNLVAARTGLTLVTINSSLRRDYLDWTRLRPTAPWVLSAPFALVFVWYVLVQAQGLLAYPFTAVMPVNMYLAASVAFVAVSLAVGVMAGAIITVKRLTGPLPTVRLPPPPAIPSEERVAFAYRMSRRQRLIIGFYGLIMASWLPAAAMAMVAPSSQAARHNHVELLGALGFVGLIGLLACVLAALDRPTILTADDLGLAISRPQVELIPWNEVREVAYKRSSGGDSFEVTRSANGGKISWPARELRLVPPTDGRPAITPEELCAVVVARSGVALTIRDEG